MKTMRGATASLRMMSGKMACAVRKAPVKLTPIIRCQWAASMRAAGALSAAPAQVTRISIGPWAARAAADVGDDRLGAGQFGGKRLERRSAPSGKGKSAAGPGKGPRDRGADAPAAAGDQRVGADPRHHTPSVASVARAAGGKADRVLRMGAAAVRWW